MVHELTKIFHWEAQEFEHHDRKIDWYWWLGALVLTGVVLSIVFKNYILAILILFAGILVFAYARKTPELIDVEISEQGIKINGEMHSFTSLDAFWLAIHEKGDTHLLLHSENAYIPMYSIPVDSEVDISDLRDYLLVFLEEVEMQEPLMQRVSYRLKF